MRFACLVLLHLIVVSSFGFGKELDKPVNGSTAASPDDNNIISVLVKSPTIANDGSRMVLEPRAGDRSFVRDIVNRLHALDADIGKLLFNGSATSYASGSLDSPEQPEETNSNFKGGQKFTEILTDLDSLQDEIGGMVYNATRARQYNILVRLRPLNTILYRIRHNLHLMRNSLVAINTVARLEKVGNSILDTTLSALMRPDATLSDEIGDNGNYDIDLDKPDDKPSTTTTTTTSTTTTSPPNTTASPPTTTSTTTAVRLRERLSTTVSTTPSTTPPTSTTTTTTTLAPSVQSSSTTQATSSTTQQSANTRRPTGSRGSTRRNTHRRRTTTTTTTTTKPADN